MASITFALDPGLKSRMSRFSWVNWSELARQRLIEREVLAERMLRKLHSKEEQELIRWSVGLGRKAKNGRRLISSLTRKEKEEFGL